MWKWYHPQIGYLLAGTPFILNSEQFPAGWLDDEGNAERRAGLGFALVAYGAKPDPLYYESAEVPNGSSITYAATARPLADVQAEARTRIDSKAEARRLVHLTPGSAQAMVYQAKEAEARAFQADATPISANYPHLSAEVGVTAPTLAEVAAVVIGLADQWRQISAAIEGARLTAKAAIASAATVEAVAAAEAAAWVES